MQPRQSNINIPLLAFNKNRFSPLRQLVIPEMGRVLTGDKDSYQYLIESIERFLSQE